MSAQNVCSQGLSERSKFMANNIVWSIRKDTIEKLAELNKTVTAVDVDRAISAKVKAEIANLTFKSRGADAKLSVTADLRIRYSDGKEAESSAEFKPFAALLRFSSRWDAMVKEFGRMELGGLPDNPEFKDLTLWVKTLKARTTKDAEKPETKPETVNA